MKKPILSMLLLLLCVAAYAQNPSYTDKLFYTCKLYGFVKYYHSEVSTCKVNWDSILIDRLPAVKAAITKDDFNDVLMEMLNAAGPMAQAGTPLPDTLPAELKRNRDWGWTTDALLRNDVSATLNNIKANFIPHDICWVKKENNWLTFPADTNYIENIWPTLPALEKRYLMFFKYWNILNYFNPYKYVLDKSWDSTFYNIELLIRNSSTPNDFIIAIVKMNKFLDDVHVELSNPNYLNISGSKSYDGDVRYASGKYIVTIPYGPLKRGDEITHVDGLSVNQWEDSLRPYISTGNEVAFRRMVKGYMFTGSGENITVQYKDSLGNTNVYTSKRKSSPKVYNGFYPTDSLRRSKIIYFDCGIVYINPAHLTLLEIQTTLPQIYNTNVMIVDMRNSPAIDNINELAGMLYGHRTTFTKLAIADDAYPGTFNYIMQNIGKENNHPYQGRVILLTYENIQSSGEWRIMHLQQVSGITTIGTSTAGADGDVTYVTNIIEGARFCFTSLGVYYPNGDSTQRIGVGPRKPGDVLVQLTQEGIRHNRDEILEAALKAAGCPLNTEEINSVMSGVIIFPNPTSGTFSVEVDKNTTATVSIFSQTGQLVLQTKQTENIDISSLPAGTYMAQIVSDSKTYTTKLAKQ